MTHQHDLFSSLKRRDWWDKERAKLVEGKVTAIAEKERKETFPSNPDMTREPNLVQAMHGLLTRSCLPEFRRSYLLPTSQSSSLGNKNN